ncbi:putative serine protease K12H4.7 [Drosophila grimshawi]|uniref:Pro-X carboxypeptidase n=1 Tax=Drosophila grimshawi TaxID=7222 RepID=B4JZ05_DROGR|nr:putative serine protease K12H4.7 [Drosophila grimshawi]EDV98620.1 Pro-X carboxypeptidase [Drosophila grimshawi]
MLVVQLVSLLLVVLASQANSLKWKKDVPVFVKTLWDLHRGPPQQKGISLDKATEEWITQPLDHFDESNEKTYQMRYLINDEFQTEGSPIFIYLGGEWEVSPGMIEKGHWYDLAKEHKGLLIYTEHRYYGNSVPTEKMTVDDLQYLHVKQALADVKHFITTLKSENAQLANSKVLLAGGSYSATMVVWFKRLYPDLVVGGWASSAPLLAKVDFFEYKEVTGKAFAELGGQKCYDRIQKGIADLEYMFDNKRSAEARSMLRLCSSFDHENDLDMWNLFGSISNVFASLAQYQQPGEIDYYCTFLLTFDDDATAIANFVYWAWGYETCTDARYQETVDYFLSAIEDFGAARPWYYQTCNEYGWYQSSRSLKQPFGTKFPATFYIEMCKDVFSSKYGNEMIQSNTAQTNLDFGGMEPNVENVYMTHGELDPWSAIGHGVAEGATVISKASHCNDFGSISPSDSSEMRASKERIAELVREWLA